LVEQSPGHVRWSLAAPVESTLVLPLNERGLTSPDTLPVSI